jgi:outer membrane protein assembly factor BamB
LYFGSTEGKLIAVNVADFRVLWSFETQGFKEHGPEFVKPDGSPNAEAIYRTDFYEDMVSGLGRIMSMGAIIGSPLVDGTTIYVGSGDGNLYALM